MSFFSYLISFVTVFVTTSLSFSQQSFLLDIEVEPPSFMYAGMPGFVGVNGSASSFVVISDLTDVLWMQFDSVGASQESYVLDFSTFQYEPFQMVLTSYQNRNDFHLFGGSLHNITTGEKWPAVFLTNFEDSVFLGRRVGYRNNFEVGLLGFVSDTSFVLQHAIDTAALPLAIEDVSTDSLGLALLNEAGEVLWSFFYQIVSSNWDAEYNTSASVAVFPNGDISIVGGEGDGKNIYNFFFLRIDTNGEVVESERVLADSTWEVQYQLIDELGDVYLAGRIKREDSLFYAYDGFIAKFDEHYNPLWVRKFFVENSSCYDLKIELLSDGSLSFAFRSYSIAPLVLGKIDAFGQLLWVQGYGSAYPSAAFDKDGRAYFLSHLKFFQNGIFDPTSVQFARTTFDGEIESCPQYEVCLDVIDEDLFDVENVFWTKHEAGDLPLLPCSVESAGVETEPYCVALEEPSPYFYTVDTICKSFCWSPDSLENSFASIVRWDISGPDFDTSIWVSKPELCFPENGVYVIEQHVWFFGCSDFYSRELVVLPDDLDLLGADRTLCDDPPFSLSANAERPLTSYFWSNGSTAPELEVNSSGTYSLEAFDGYCTLRDTVALTFLQDLLTEGPPLILPADTVVCEQHLPYVLAPYSPYTEIPPQQLWQAGSYAVETEVFGCPFLENFELSLSDCRSRIYMPTAFSPNGDGLNDQFLPQGKDYEGIELQVYDRWGGLLYSTREVPFAWDGGDAPAGVYTWLFRYLNTLSGEEEVLSGEVNLVR